MENYLIAVDLDETLLTSDKKIKFKTIRFVRKLYKKGTYFVIATGRPFQGALRFYKKLGINVPMIATNGGAIFYFNDDLDTIKDIKTFPMKKDDFLSFYLKAKPFIKQYMVRCPLSYHYKNYDSIPFHLIHPSPRVSMHEDDIETSLVNDPIDADFQILKEYKNDFINLLKEYPDFKYIYWGPHDDYEIFEVNSAFASKSKALYYLANELNYKKENLMGFGDQLNDKSLFELPIGVAMINACNDIKNLAKYVTKKDNNHNGVVLFVKDYIKNN